MGIGDRGSWGSSSGRGSGMGIGDQPCRGIQGITFLHPSSESLEYHECPNTRCFALGQNDLHLDTTRHTPSGTGIAWRGEQGPEGSIPAGAVRWSVNSVALGVDSDAAALQRAGIGPRRAGVFSNLHLFSPILNMIYTSQNNSSYTPGLIAEDGRWSPCVLLLRGF